MLPTLQKFQGHLVDGPQVFIDAMESIEQVMRRVGKIYVYASMEANVDATNQAAAAMESKPAAAIPAVVRDNNFLQTNIHTLP